MLNQTFCTEEMATKKNNIVEEEVLNPKAMVYGDGDPEPGQQDGGSEVPGGSEEPGQGQGDAPAVDSSTGDTSTNQNEEENTEMTLQESIQAQLKRGSEIVDMGPNYKETYAGSVKDASLGAGAAQASNMQTATTVGARIPQVDTSEYAVRARFTANGKNAGADSDFAVKATGEGAGFKPTKDVKKNAFPEDGAGYQEVVNTQSY